MSLSRRQFFESAALSSIAAQAALAAQVDPGTGMPTRILGKTNARVSIIAFGSGSRFLSYEEEDKALEALERGLKAGISYIDTAYGYGSGKSEERVGKLMPEWRKNVFLATKINVRGGDEALRILEGSLKRLRTDQVDVIHIHSLTNEEDLAKVEAKDGVLQALYKLRDQKVTRFVGVTSHTDPNVLRTALDRHDFDCTQMALNAARVGMVNAKGGMKLNENHTAAASFESLALPVANRKKMGVIAMKIFGQEGLNGKAPVDKLIRYSLSLPVSVAVLGMPKLEYIDENVRVAKAFAPLPKDEMRQLSSQLAGAHKAELDRWFADHVDA